MAKVIFKLLQGLCLTLCFIRLYGGFQFFLNIHYHVLFLLYIYVNGIQQENTYI
jgi:uncharacterized membrane protein